MRKVEETGEGERDLGKHTYLVPYLQLFVLWYATEIISSVSP